MEDLETIYRDGWYIRSAFGRATQRFIAWCKREMFTGTDLIDEPGNVYFEYGTTRERAIEHLLAIVN